MVNVRETGIAFHSETAENLRQKQNSFLGFIEENKDLFDEHISLTYELRDEEKGWKDSLAIDSMEAMMSELMFLAYPEANDARGKHLRKARKTVKAHIAAMLFADSSEYDKKLKEISFLGYGRLSRSSPKVIALAQTFQASVEDSRRSFLRARSPLAAGVQESRAELLKRLQEFLLLNPSSLFALQDFISDKKNYGADREAIRPFLANLAETEKDLVKNKKEGILHGSVTKWVDELKENPTPAIIDEFTASIKSLDIFEWLEFAADRRIKAPDGIEKRDEDFIRDIANFLKSRSDLSTWPKELREALFLFVSSKYFSALSSIVKDLEEFKRPLLSKSMPLLMSQESGKKRAAAVIRPANGSDTDSKRALEVEAIEHPIGVLTKIIGSPYKIRVLTEEEFNGFLQKEADSLAPSDSRMLEDLKKIVTSLRRNPHGFGTEKLISRNVAVGNRKSSLRSFNPRLRTGLSNNRPGSLETRIVYVIDGNGPESVIGIEGIYRHDDYMKRFGG